MTHQIADQANLIELCIANLTFRPEPEQKGLIEALSKFVFCNEPRKAFVLNGFAGTGKTSVMAALIKSLASFNIKSVTLAPTGRAAKVASEFSGSPAATIHRHIYRPISHEPGNENFILAANRLTDTIFIIDEASMITDAGGDRSLLLHLVRFVYSAPGCSIVFVGDVAQLPPVGHTDSPAMNLVRLRQLGLFPEAYNLRNSMRQSHESGILANATAIRRFLFGKPSMKFHLKASGFTDVETVSPTELADCLSSSWAKVGTEETLIISRSNKRANNFNAQIRSRVLFAEDAIQRGERLIVSRNDYYWCAKNKVKGFIANGETVEVKWVGNLEKAHGRYFVDAELQVPSRPEPLGVKIMLRSLMSDGPTIPRDEQQRFFTVVADSYEGEYSQKIKGVMNDPYYNALQVKYAYCVTCHKAQGGQWRHVYLDVGTIAPEAIGPDFYRWLYTAVTRATEKLFLVNPSFSVV